MGWRRTVRCSYCYQEGHNRAGCPKRKADAAKDPDSYTARQLKREQEKRKKSIEGRSCTYCNGDERGGHAKHNRRGCKLKKQDMQTLMESVKQYRKAAAEAMIEAGLGVGSLIQVPADGGKILYMIESIKWEMLTHRLGGKRWDASQSDDDWGLDYGEREPIMARVVSSQFETKPSYWLADKIKPMYRESINFRNLYLKGLSPYDRTELPEQLERNSISIAARISSDAVRNQIPDNFLEMPIPRVIQEKYNFNSGWRQSHIFDKKEGDNA